MAVDVGTAHAEVQPTPPREVPYFYKVHYNPGGPVSSSGQINIEGLKTAPFDNLVYTLATNDPPPNFRQLPQDVLLQTLRRVSTVVAEESDRIGEQRDILGQYRANSVRDFVVHMLVDYRRDPDANLSPEIIQTIRDFRNSPSTALKRIEAGNIAKLIVLDERNANNGIRIGIREEVEGEILEDLRNLTDNPDPGTRNFFEYGDLTERKALGYGAACGKEATKKLMTSFLEESTVIQPVALRVFGNALGFETMLPFISELARSNDEIRTKLEALSKKIGLHKGDEIFWDVGDFYKAVNFEGYTPYSELQKADEDFLLKELQGKKRVIDFGCGEGRHIIPLLEAGIPVEGVEVNPAAAAAIQAKAPQARVHITSADRLPAEVTDGTVDAFYWLGRGITHVKNLKDAIDKFNSFRKAGTSDCVILFDKPTGEEIKSYKEERRQFLWDRLHIWNHESGAIHSSPNKKDYLDRFVLSYSQIYAISILLGFKSELVQSVAYTGPSGKPAINQYWKFTKDPRGPLYKEAEIDEHRPFKFMDIGRFDKSLDIDSN